MKYILDSDTITYFYNTELSEHGPVAKRFRQLRNTDVVQVSLITLFELEYSLYNAPPANKAEIQKQIDAVEQDFNIIHLQREHAAIYGEIKTHLRKITGNSTKGMRKHNIDLIVTSTAIFESSILVANDEIYEKLAEIDSRFQYENWTL